MRYEEAPSGSVFVRLASHRARERVGRVLESRLKAYCSFHRDVGTGGVYLLTQEELRRVKAAKIAGVTRLRGPYRDLFPCLSWK